MKRNILCIFFIIVICCLNISCKNQEKDKIRSIYGKWKIIKVAEEIEDGGVTRWTDKMVRDQIGTTVSFGPNLVNLIEGNSCKMPTYTLIKEENVDDFLLSDYNMNSRQIEIGIGIKAKSLEVISLDCIDITDVPGAKTGADIFIVDQDTIILTAASPFFYLKRVKDTKFNENNKL